MAINKRIIRSNDEAAGGASFNTVLYTGTFGVESVTGFGFDPDLVWIKNRTNTASHILFDRVRGARYPLFPDLTDAEAEQPIDAQNFITDGFSVSGNWIITDANANNYVMWGWKAGGAAVLNQNGSTESYVSANVEAGFSVVSYNGGGGSNTSIGHGLNAEPKVIIAKGRDFTQNWAVYHRDVGPNKWLQLNTTSAAISENIFANTFPNSNVFYLNNNVVINGAGNQHIAYCFAEVAGFSKFGSYTGTGTSGKSVTTDFEPAFILVKRTDNISAWRMIDNKRFSGGNKSSLSAQTSASEQVGYIDIDFNSTNFTINSTNVDFNASGGTYVFMAFANQF